VYESTELRTAVAIYNIDRIQNDIDLSVSTNGASRTHNSETGTP